MNMKVFVMKDEKTGVFLTPVFSPSLPEYNRSLIMGLRQQPQSLVFQFPQDYSVWGVGDWDPERGMLEGQLSPTFHYNVVSIMPEVKA